MGSSAETLSIRRESLLSAAANVVLIGTNLGTLGALATALESSSLGAYFYALSAALLAIIPSRELSQVMRKRLSEPETPSGEYFGLAQFGTLALLVPFAGALLLAEPLLVAHTPFTGATLFAFGVYTAVLTQSAMSTRLYDAVGSPGASMLAQAVREAVFLGVVLGLVHVGTASAALVLLARAAVHLIAALGIYAVVGVVPRLPSRHTLSHGFAFGKWSAPTGLAGRLWSETPTMLMGVLLGGPAVALFETAKRVTVAGSYLSTCINDPLLVKASALDSDDERIPSYVELAVDYTPSVAIPILFVFAPVADEVLRAVGGTSHAAGGLVLVGVALTHVLAGLKTPVSSGLWGIDRPRYVFYLTVAAVLVGAPAVALGASVAGVAGAVAALVAVGAVEVAGALGAAALTFDRPLRPRTLHVQVAAGTVAAAVVWALAAWVPPATGTSLVALLGAGLAVHYGLFALVSEQFRHGAARTVRDVSRVASTAVRPSLTRGAAGRSRN